jgi:DeoR/GlpR family transcriptional regulator of sugar metabolism
VDQLADECGVSIMTVHRDLDELEARGFLRKVRGGATSAPTRTFHGDLAHRMQAEAREKQLMAEFVVQREIAPGQVVAIDDSTTSLTVARLLPQRAPLTVVTHFLPVIRALAEQPGIELIGLGGRFVPAYDSFLGQATAAAAAELQTDVLIMSTTAVTDGVCYIQSQDTVITRRALIASAARTVALVDHTKFGRRALHRLVGLPDLDRVVVDPDTPPHVVADLRRRSVAVEVAPELA